MQSNTNQRQGVMPYFSERGSSLVYIIALMTMVAAMGAGVAVMTPTASLTSLEENKKQEAYFAAMSGERFAEAVRAYYTSETVAVSLGCDETAITTSILNTLNASPGYNISSTGRFSVSASAVSASSYRINSVTGSAWFPNKGIDAGFVALNDAAGVLPIISIPKPTWGGCPSTQSPASQYVLYTGDGYIDTGWLDNVDGDIYGGDVEVDTGSSVSGNVTSKGEVTVSYLAYVGGDICAQDRVWLGTGAQVGGTITTQGNVALEWFNETGSIYSGGTVVVGGDSTINGDIHAQGNVTIEYDSTVNGSIYTKGTVTIDEAATVTGSVHAGSTIRVKWHGRIQGNAYAGGSITVDSGGQIVGTQASGALAPPRILPTAPSACAVVPEPTLATYSAGASDVNVSWGDSRVINPGSYRDLNAGGSNTITLKGGTYYFRRIDIDWGSTLRFDLSGGDVLIFVTDYARFDGSMAVRVSTNGSSYSSMTSVDSQLAAKVYLETHNYFRIDWDSDWFGTILAKNDIDFNGAIRLIGAYATVDGHIDSDSLMDVTYVPANYAKANW